MAATPWPEPFQDDNWRYELKWDGIRAILTHAAAGDTTLTSRRGNDISERYPGLRNPQIDGDAVVDGEIVALDDGGRPSFELLQGRMNLSSPRLITAAVEQIPITYVAFDLLYRRWSPRSSTGSGPGRAGYAPRLSRDSPAIRR